MEEYKIINSSKFRWRREEQIDLTKCMQGQCCLLNGVSQPLVDIIPRCWAYFGVSLQRSHLRIAREWPKDEQCSLNMPLGNDTNASAWSLLPIV